MVLTGLVVEVVTVGELEEGEDMILRGKGLIERAKLVGKGNGMTFCVVLSGIEDIILSGYVSEKKSKFAGSTR